MTEEPFRWTCLFHGRKDDHWCVQCCICFTDLQREDCNVRPDGKLEDICKSCAKDERYK